jgi:hypothetical protein
MKGWGKKRRGVLKKMKRHLKNQQLNITHKKIQTPHNEQHHIIYVPDEAHQERVSPRAAAWLPHKREHSFADCR